VREQARAILEPAVANGAGSPWLAFAQYQLGEILLVLSRREEAVALLEKAAANLGAYRGFWAEPCLMRLLVQQQGLGRWDDAIATARRYIELFPDKDSAYAQFSIGKSYVAKGDMQAAVLELEKLLGGRGGAAVSLEALKALGLAYRALNRYADAAAAFQRLFEAGGSDERGFALVQLGQIQMAQGDIRGAMATFQRVVDEYGSSKYATAARLEIENCRLTIELGGLQ
jgi:tetratricopeptide (TPR) repeat protein